jgi:nitrite reductase/ring-hydroxylating ferredoxin subunit
MGVTESTSVAEPARSLSAEINLTRNLALTLVATYRRTIGASLARVWENVLDWEHLPWLHSKSFAEISCHAAGDWGWRAEVRYPGGEEFSQIELLTRDAADNGNGKYVTRLLSGPGLGGEVWTTLTGVGEHQTDIVVEFCLAVSETVDTDALGKGYLGLYAMLWDEDEAMMQRRQGELDRVKGGSTGAEIASADAIELGTLADVRSQLPLDIDAFGTRLRIVELDSEWLVYPLTCPHSLGPLDQSEIEDGQIECPWHGYRFDLRTGESCDGRSLRLRKPARLEIDSDADRVRLLPANAHH